MNENKWNILDKSVVGFDEIRHFEERLREEERSEGTIEKYLRDVRQFCEWLGVKALTKDVMKQWKEELMDQGYRPTTVNGKIASINRFFEALHRSDLKVKVLRIQRRVFRDVNRDLTRDEYEELIKAAKTMGKKRLCLLMETICSTGIRVSELKYITLEAVRRGKAEIHLKGKIRVILLPGKLCRKLLKYSKERRICKGQIFLTRNGTAISRKQIWSEMKALCKTVGIEDTKVFPHNLRHLFAKCFYKACRDLARLADVLGHSSVETTRIYLITSGVEHVRTMEQLRLIL